MLLCGGILLSGSCPKKILRLLQQIGLCTVSESTYYDVRGGDLWPAINAVRKCLITGLVTNCQLCIALGTIFVCCKYPTELHIYVFFSCGSESSNRCSVNELERVCLAGDGRCDSSGHCAKCGTYTFMDATSNKVLHVELAQATFLIF